MTSMINSKKLFFFFPFFPFFDVDKSATSTIWISNVASTEIDSDLFEL